MEGIDGHAGAEPGELAKAWGWIREKWLELRIECGSISAAELKAHGEAGARALAGCIKAGSPWARARSMELAEEMGAHPMVTASLVAVAVGAKTWKDRAIAVMALGKAGSSAGVAAGLVDVLEALKRGENGALLRGEEPDKDGLLLQKMANKALGKVAEGLSFRDYAALALSRERWQREWALENINPLSLSEEEADALRGLEEILKKEGPDSGKELRRVRGILLTWETDRTVMAELRLPRGRMPAEPGAPKKAGREPERLKK
jgi:hypothetical protein